MTFNHHEVCGVCHSEMCECPKKSADQKAVDAFVEGKTVLRVKDSGCRYVVVPASHNPPSYSILVAPATATTTHSSKLEPRTR